MFEPPNISWGKAFRGSKHLLTGYDWRMTWMSRDGIFLLKIYLYSIIYRWLRLHGQKRNWACLFLSRIAVNCFQVWKHPEVDVIPAFPNSKRSLPNHHVSGRCFFFSRKKWSLKLVFPVYQMTWEKNDDAIWQYVMLTWVGSSNYIIYIYIHT